MRNALLAVVIAALTFPAAAASYSYSKGSAAAPATCAAALAGATGNKSQKTTAALTYIHGMFMGRPCGTVDYQRGIALLRAAGDEADVNSVIAMLKVRASTGNPRAVAALASLGVGP